MRLSERLGPSSLLLAASLFAGCDGPSEPAVATQLAFNTAPSATTTNGAVLAQPPVIQLRDAGGKAVSRSGVSVTVGINSGGGTLGGTTTVVTSRNGRATFADLSITGVIGLRTLTFGASALTSVVSGAIAVTAGPASRLELSTAPSTTSPSDVMLGQQPAVQVQDVSGNPVAAAGLSVVATLASGGGALIGTTTRMDTSTETVPSCRAAPQWLRPTAASGGSQEAAMAPVWRPESPANGPNFSRRHPE